MASSSGEGFVGDRVRRGWRPAVLALWVGALAVPRAESSELVIDVAPPFAGENLWVGEAGDTLVVRATVRDDVGQPVPGVRLVAATLAESAARAVYLAEDVATDERGRAELAFVLGRVPGEHVVQLSAVGEPGGRAAIRVRVLRLHWGRAVFLGVAGGLALFLYGMQLLGRGLETAAGGRIREYLSTMTASPLRSVVFGIVSTFAVQSSGASTVLLVSFASAGLIAVRQCLAATLGAAIGSSFTVQLIAFHISDYALLFVAVGFLLSIARGAPRRIGGILLGGGLAFYGLALMSDATTPLKGLPAVHRFLADASRDPLPALIAGAVFTALVHTSSATLGILLSLAFQGLITLEMALPVVLGANIGTATTAILASLGANADGKRVAWAHAAFRLAGALAFLPFLGQFAAVVQGMPGDTARQIANAHMLLAVVTAAIFLPFIPLADRLFRALIRDDRPAKDDRHPRALDPRFHEQPTIAIAGALREVLHMGTLAQEMLADVGQALRRSDVALARSIRERDDRVDQLDEEITRYLTDLSTGSLSGKQSERVLDLFFVTKDFELIADIVSKGLVPGLLDKRHDRNLRFSEEGFRQLLDFHDRVQECVTLAVAAVATWDPEVARQVLDAKRKLSVLERKMHIDHMERLRAGNQESRATTTLHVDAVSDLKRIVTHAARIAYAVLGKVHERPEDPDAGEHASLESRPAGAGAA